ncbi:MAG: glycosyltransferase, partial [Bacteroidetes bacterium]
MKFSNNISLICTVYNEANNISAFLDSISSQSVLPGEFIIVDGGSTDGTAELVQQYLSTGNLTGIGKLIIDPSCNKKHSKGPIAKARNLAISACKNEIIAVTDAGCILKGDWLENITAPLVKDSTIDVVCGWYEPLASTFWQQSIAWVIMVPPENVSEESSIPSSRSIAFRKKSWKEVGGYSEDSYSSEDTKFFLELKRRGCRIAWRQDAIVLWKVPSNLKWFLWLNYKYGMGDGANKMLWYHLFVNLGKLSMSIIFLGLGFLFHGIFLFLFIALWGGLIIVRRPEDSIKLSNIIKMPIIIAAKIVYDT